MAETTEKSSLTDALPTDALKDAGQKLLGLLVQRAAEAATDRVSNLSDRLTGVTENGGQGLRTVLGRGGERAEGEDDTEDDEDDEDKPKGALSRGFSNLKDKIKSAFGGGGGSGGQKKLKVTVISESQDVGLPLRTTYDLWTQFADFPTFMKKVESVEQASDEKTNWKAQVFLSHRTWEATIAEQVPDSHIVWRSKGPKGHVDGAVSFTGLGPNLTRVMLILEYYPQGLFERTGNLWRAQGRRARLEFQHFRRHAMSNVLLHQEDVEGWRGTIHDSEVVTTHEEALEEEQRAQEESQEEGGAEDTAATDTEGTDSDAEGTDAEGEAYGEAEGYEGDGEYTAAGADESETGAEDVAADTDDTEADVDDEYAEDEYADEADEADEEDLEDEYADEEPDEDAAADSEADEDVADEDVADDEAADDEAEETREPVAASRSRRGR